MPLSPAVPCTYNHFEVPSLFRTASGALMPQATGSYDTLMTPLGLARHLPEGVREEIEPVVRARRTAVDNLASPDTQMLAFSPSDDSTPLSSADAAFGEGRRAQRTMTLTLPSGPVTWRQVPHLRPPAQLDGPRPAP